jgi:hypothetical protein
MVCEDRKLYKATGLMFQGQGQLLLQVECEVQGCECFNVRECICAPLVTLNDPFSITYECPHTQPFSARLAAWHDFVEVNPDVNQLVQTKKWYPRPALVPTLSDGRREIVCQPIVAVAGHFHGVGSARYLKTDWTIDLLMPGGVQEFQLREDGSVGKFLRNRPDKSEGNSRKAAARQLEAATEEDVECLLKPVSASAMLQLFDYLSHPHTYSGKQQDLMLFYLYRTRYDVWDVGARIEDNRRVKLSEFLSTTVRAYSSTPSDRDRYVADLVVHAPTATPMLVDDDQLARIALRAKGKSKLAMWKSK